MMAENNLRETGLVYDEAILSGWLNDCVPENEIQRHVMLDFARIF